MPEAYKQSASRVVCCRFTAAQHGAVGRSLRVYHCLAGGGYGKPSGSLCACGNSDVPAAH